MTATNTFFIWFYYGLNGIGGWVIFLLLAIIAVIWLLYNSASRRIPALGWRMGAILTAFLILPAIIYRFTVTDPADWLTSPLAPYSELIFYLGLLGGILPVVLAIGYFVSFRGMVGCPQGHVYEQVLGRCPECAKQERPVIDPYRPPVREEDFPRPPRETYVEPLEPPRPKVPAWLTAQDGRSHQLYKGESTIGRTLKNDICLKGDSTVSKVHAKIVEKDGRFVLYDLGSTNYTRVNGRVVRQPVLLEPDDEIQFGENTKVRFVSQR